MAVERMECECCGCDIRAETRLHHANIKLKFMTEDVEELKRIIRELLEPPPQPTFDEDPFRF